jgi:hypothetical protein
VVFFGRKGLGRTQNLEYTACVRQHSLRPFRMIPVVLSDVEGKPQIPALLTGDPIDFRIADPDPLDRLIHSITEARHLWGDTAAAAGA